MKFQRNLFITLVVLLSIVCGLIYYLFQNINQSEGKKQWEVHSQEVLEQTKILQENNETQLAIARGYLETKNNLFVQDFDVSTMDFTTSKTRLLHLISDNKQQTATAEEITRIFEKKIELFYEIVKISEDTTVNLKETPLVERYNIADLDIDALCATMIERESDLLSQRENEFSENVARSKAVVAILFVLLLLILFFAFRYTFYNYKILEKAKNKLEQNNNELLEYKTRFNESLDYAKVAIFDWSDTANQNFWISDSFAHMLGYDPADFDSTINGLFNVYMHPEDAERVDTELREAVENGKEYNVEYRLRKKNGKYTHFRAIGETFETDGMRKMIGVVINIDRELKIKKANESVINTWEEFSTRFDLTLESSTYGVWDWLNIQRPQQWWSSTFYDLIGYTPEELPPSIGSFRELIHPEDQKKVQESVDNNLQTGKQLSVDYRIKTKHFGYQWFRASGNHIKNSDGSIRMIGVVSDLSHEKSIMEELERSNAESRKLRLRCLA